MFARYSAVVSVFLWLSADALEKIPAHEKIQNYVRSLSPKVGTELCGSGTTCCNVTTTEACPISAMKKDESTIVLPGGETRCIYSYSTPFGFQVSDFKIFSL